MKSPPLFVLSKGTRLWLERGVWQLHDQNKVCSALYSVEWEASLPSRFVASAVSYTMHCCQFAQNSANTHTMYEENHCGITPCFLVCNP